jgi:photosystem II stability/assembly factor-like uncharacterized protein
VAVHPSQPSVVYAGAAFGTFRSTDGGITWKEVFDRTQRAVRALELHIAPSDPNTVYAVGVPWWRTTDGGATWDRLEGLNMGPNSALVHPTIASTVYMGNSSTLFKSTDSGYSWSVLLEPPPLHNADALVMDPTNLDTLYVGSWDGVRRSLNGGITWSGYNEGLYFGRGVTQLSFSADGSALFAGLWHHGVYRRPRDGQWAERNRGLIASDIRALVVAPSKGNVIYSIANNQGVAKSRNGGASWEWAGLRGVGLDYYSLAVHPRNHRIVYAGAHTGVYRTSDGGKSWKRKLVTPSIVTTVAIAPSNPRIVYVGTIGDGVFRSRNGGASWKRTRLPNLVIFSIGVHPRKPKTVYVRTRFEHIVKTIDGGKTWRVSLPGAHLDPRTIVFDSTRPRIVYMGGDAAGVYRTINGGRSWQFLNGGTPPERTAAIAIDPRNPRVLYAAGNAGDYSTGFGVFRSIDRGQTWTRMGEGLTTTGIASLAISPSGSVLHAGSSTHVGGGGVFSYRF